MSLTDLTVRVAAIAAFALLALIAVGWRQPARQRVRSHPTERSTKHDNEEPSVTPGDVVKQRLLRIGALGGIAVVASAVVATLVSVALAWLVTNIIDRL
ncbi:MAG: hypothetical protein ACO28Q_10615 [Ilumatobacteraceae bacterium]